MHVDPPLLDPLPLPELLPLPDDEPEELPLDDDPDEPPLDDEPDELPLLDEEPASRTPRRMLPIPPVDAEDEQATNNRSGTRGRTLPRVRPPSRAVEG